MVVKRLCSSDRINLISKSKVFFRLKIMFKPVWLPYEQIILAKNLRSILSFNTLTKDWFSWQHLHKTGCFHKTSRFLFDWKLLGFSVSDEIFDLNTPTKWIEFHFNWFGSIETNHFLIFFVVQRKRMVISMRFSWQKKRLIRI